MSYPGGLHSSGLYPLLFLENVFAAVCCNATGLCFLTDSTFSFHLFIPAPSLLTLLIPLPPLSPSLTFLSSLDLLLMPTMLPHAPYGVHAHTAWLHHLIVNTVAGCYFHGQALGLNAVIPTCFCAIFRLRKHTWMFQKFWKWKIHHDGRLSCKLWQNVRQPWLCQ